MAVIRCTKICVFFFFLAAFADFGLGQSGSIHIVSNASQSMSIRSGIVYKNGTTYADTVSTTMAPGSVLEGQIEDGVLCARTVFDIYTPAPHHQLIADWCLEPNSMKISCLDCWWIVDDNGFSVADSEHSTQTFVVGWE